jgi:hypothetical protein
MMRSLNLKSYLQSACVGQVRVNGGLPTYPYQKNIEKNKSEVLTLLSLTDDRGIMSTY